MRLTLWTDYALRTLIHIGANRPLLSTIAEIATSFDISKAHLMKIVNRLAQLGYIETIRGKGGGLRLACPPSEIGIGAVVRAVEADLAVMGCLSQRGFCRIESCCVLRGVLGEATAAFLARLDRCTLADLLVPRPALRQALALALAPANDDADAAADAGEPPAG
jgi:Rrf2 family nitric oxide-sensitive transcriptional repressor